MAIQVDTKPRGVESGVVAAQFDKAVGELHENGYEVISLPTNAQLRTEHGGSAPITRNGNYTRHAIVYAKGAQPLFVRDSPLVADSKLAAQAVEANRQGNYFTTGADLYEQSLEIAEADRGEEPINRRVLILPGRDWFNVSGEKNPETFDGLFGQFGADYLNAIGLKSLKFLTVPINIVDSQDGTLLTELMLRSHRIGNFGMSGLSGLDMDLCSRVRVRGVRSFGEAGAREISDDSQSVANGELPYSPAQVRQYKSLVDEVRTGQRPNADLSDVVAFFQGLRTE